jgi:hypothetical protein
MVSANEFIFVANKSAPGTCKQAPGATNSFCISIMSKAVFFGSRLAADINFASVPTSG